MVVSLLETQSAYLQNEALLAVQNSQHRVHAMSIIHQKLYQNENMLCIDMSVYLAELIHYLRDSFNTGNGLQINTHIENIHLDISQAIPIGLIINEAVTNSIKYAFPGKQNGEIYIRMRKTSNEKILLTIADNGIGFPDKFKINGDTLGLRLMKGLSEDIHALFGIDDSNGIMIKVEFSEQQFNEQIQKQKNRKIAV